MGESSVYWSYIFVTPVYPPLSLTLPPVTPDYSVGIQHTVDTCKHPKPYLKADYTFQTTIFCIHVKIWGCVNSFKKNESSKLCFLKPSIVHNGPCSASTTHTCSAIAADLNTVSQDGLKHFSGITTNTWMSTLPETKIWHLKMNGWKVRFLLGKPIFRCYAGFTKC